LHSVGEAQDILPGVRKQLPDTRSATASRSSNFATGAAAVHHQWKWSLTRRNQRRKTQPGGVLRERYGLVGVPLQNPKASALKTTPWSGRWINESKNGSKMESTNVKAVYLTKRSVMPWFMRWVWKGGEVGGLVDGNTFRLKQWNAWQWSPNLYGKWKADHSGTREGHFDLASLSGGRFVLPSW
jgi:hypothetical protein